MSKLTSIGRVSYPELFAATQVAGQGAFKYRVTLIFDADDPWLKQLRADVEASAKAFWPTKRPKDWRDPLIDGDSLENTSPETDGKIIVRLTANDDRQPGVVDHQVAPITRESGKLYAGCYARASYSVYSYSKAGNNGTAIGINNLQVVRDGDPLGSARSKAEDDFNAVPADELPDDDAPF